MIRPPIIWRNVTGAVATSHLWFIEIVKRIPRALVWLENNEAALLKVYGARPQ